MNRPLEFILWHNTVLVWLIALGVCAAMFGIINLILGFVKGRVATFAQHSATVWDNVLVHTLEKTKQTFVVLVSLYAGFTFLVLPARVTQLFGVVVAIAVLVQLGLWLSTGLSFWLRGYTQRQLAHDRGVATTVSAIGFVAKVLIWVLLLLVALDTAGINVTAMVAGLGIGGIAVALAAQSILGDVFASLSIVMDKPFVLGDFIRVGEMIGTVEKIGLRTTRVRSLSGEGLIFPNADLLSSRIRNFGSMAQRRVVFEIGVTYQTPREQLARIPGMIRDAVTANTDMRFDRSHFMRYGDFSLNFETVYFVLTPDYNRYMDIHQAVLLSIHEQFEAEGIEFAYPTQTLILTRPTNQS